MGVIFQKMKVSIVLPTYNNEDTIEECLRSIRKQDFKDYELLIIDGGSTDKTLILVEKYNVKIIKNPYRVEEKGRAIGIKNAKGSIICFIDADNILLTENWLKDMVKPFEDKQIIGADTLYFSFRKEDSLITKYCSLMGGDDPIAIYFGIYDRYNYFKQNWTGLPYEEEKTKDYLKIRLNDNNIPAMGSNGFLFRKSILNSINYDPFIHTDIVYKIAKKGYFAKVPIGLIHVQKGILNFFQKKIRRIKRRLSGEIKLDNNYGLAKKEIIPKLIYLVLVLPVLYDTIKGFIKKPSLAWLFHPFATYITLFIYMVYVVFYKLKVK